MSRKRLARVQVILIALVVAMTGCRHKEERQLSIMIVGKPSKEDMQIYGEYAGRICATSFVKVHARVEGFLKKMLFEEDKWVKQNEPLFVINPDKYRVGVEKAKAQLKKSQAQAARTRRDVEHLKPLYEQHATSQLDLDNATAALEDIEVNITMSRADLGQAEMGLSYTIVTSPLSGYISERFVDVGALVGPGVNSELAAVVKSDAVLIDFRTTALDYLRAGHRNVGFGEQGTTRPWQPTVTVTLANDSEYPAKGIVDFVNPLVGPETGTFDVRVELSSPDQKLLSGQFAKVRLPLDVRERSIVIPREALSIEKGGTFIYIIRRDDTTKKRFVQTGPKVGNKVVIKQGLGENERVMVKGYHKLVPGVKIHTVKADDEKAIRALRKGEER